MNDRSGTARQLLAGVGTLALAAVPALRPEPPRLEARIFESINDLPDALFIPVWPVMQLGALAAVPITAGIAAATGHPSLSRRLAVTAGTTWLIAKVVKRGVGRGRPEDLIPLVHVRGRAATGEGFLSGHAGIATALAVTAAQMFPGHRVTLTGLAATVGLARIYVGAHLPLDVVGGAALALSVDAAFTYLVGPCDPIVPAAVRR